MNSILQDTLDNVEGRAREGAQRLLWPVLFALAAGLFGLVGLGFLTVWAYLTLSTALGAGSAALTLGLGYTGLAGLALVIARARPPTPVVAQPPHQAPNAPPPQPQAPVTDTAAMVAFTAAFVLGRYMSRDKPDGPQPD